jgi:hypothetical protein
MDVIYFLLLILSFILFILGLAQIFGFGWALFITDFLFRNTGSSANDYSGAQNDSKKGNKLLGFLFIIISIAIFYFIGSI